MVGRNDPCPCGSGKKYKKCHGNEQTANLQEMVETELALIRRRFIDEGMRNRHVVEMMRRDREWFSALEGMFPPDLIIDLSFESYAYVENRKLWTAFVKQELKKSHRPQVTEVLEAWLHPFWILAKVEDQAAELLTVKNERSGEIYTIEAPEKQVEGEWLFGIVFQNPKAKENRLQLTSGLMFIPPRHKEIMERISSKLENFDEDSLGLYQSFGRAPE
ncbi:YecA family protein [Metaplanococcus flavidus]|uniref:YecA family protein n=1 Tax=Metaplanococcus flavidus TaxID=569883 RepID=A0ABW3LEW9_9BACL